MKKYIDRENTPLKFHNFLKNGSLPLALVYYSIMIIYNLVVYGIESLASLFIIDYAFMIAAIILIIIALRGLYKWKYSAWKCIVGLFAMTLTYNILYLVILTVFNLSGDGETIMEALQSIIISPFILVYYYKRKSLFNKGESDCPMKMFSFCKNEVNKSEKSTKSKLSNGKKPLNSNSNKPKVCDKCGEMLVIGSSFCHKCGKEIKCKKYIVCIFDAENKNLRKETREIDTVKFPPLKYAVNDTYYAIEMIRDGKKVRIYYEKNNWDKQIENIL